MRRSAFVLIIFAVVTAATLVSLGQNEKQSKSTPRLPPYFADIVTPSQRKAIYALQERYAEQIADLRTQLEALTRQRDSEIDAVLTPLQLKQLQKVREAAAAKRKKSASK
jgi:hypothetical protein